jgi:hypothetical protein
MTAISTSDFRDLVAKARAQGFIVEYTSGGHWKFTPPDQTKRVFYCSSTPNRPERFIKNVKRDLRSRGAQV